MSISVAQARALRGQPLPTDDSLRVSGLRWNSEYGFHVFVSGKPRPYFMSRMALTRIPHTWEAWHSTVTPGIIVLTGPDYRASAEAAKAYFEAFVYDVSEDPEFMDCNVILNDHNAWWFGGD